MQNNKGLKLGDILTTVVISLSFYNYFYFYIYIDDIFLKGRNNVVSIGAYLYNKRKLLSRRA